MLHDVTNPEAYGGLPKDPHIPWVVRFWKGPAKWIGNLAMLGGVIGVTLHYLRFGPKQVDAAGDERRMRREDSHEHFARHSSGRSLGETGGRILRYTLSERVHHWLAGLTYIYCLITGLAFWSPYMYWLAAMVGGGPTARFWHPWFGLVFTLSVFWMYKMWRGDMLTTDADRRWSKAMKYYIENEDEKSSAHRPLQLRPEIVLLADVLRRDPAAAFRSWVCGLSNPSRGVCAGCVIWRSRCT